MTTVIQFPKLSCEYPRAGLLVDFRWGHKTQEGEGGYKLGFNMYETVAPVKDMVLVFVCISHSKCYVLECHFKDYKRIASSQTKSPILEFCNDKCIILWSAK